MNWIKIQLKSKVVKRVLALAIAAGLSYAGFSSEISKEFAKEGADIIVNQVNE